MDEPFRHLCVRFSATLRSGVNQGAYERYPTYHDQEVFIPKGIVNFAHACASFFVLELTWKVLLSPSTELLRSLCV